MSIRQLLLKNWTIDNQNETPSVASSVALREEFYILEVGKYKPMQMALMFCTKTAYLKLLKLLQGENVAFVFISDSCIIITAFI